MLDLQSELPQASYDHLLNKPQTVKLPAEIHQANPVVTQPDGTSLQCHIITKLCKLQSSVNCKGQPTRIQQGCSQQRQKQLLRRQLPQVSPI